METKATQIEGLTERLRKTFEGITFRLCNEYPKLARNSVDDSYLDPYVETAWQEYMDTHILAVKALQESHDNLFQLAIDRANEITSLQGQLEFTIGQVEAEVLNTKHFRDLAISLQAQLAGGEAVAEVYETFGYGSSVPSKHLRWLSAAGQPPAGTKLYTEAPALKQQVPEGYRLAPDFQGYALLGTGRYLLSHSSPPIDPELGAEFVITIATEADKSGNRQIGELRDTPPGTPDIQPDEIAIRIGFLSPQALDAMEYQLKELRQEHWPETATPTHPVSANQPDGGKVPDDFLTHKDSWRDAIAQAADNANCDADRSYWLHELRAYDRAHEELASAPIAEGDK